MRGFKRWVPTERQSARGSSAERPATGGLKEKLGDLVHGTSRCGCGCGKTATSFRGGKMYAQKCVSPKSGWATSGLPQDRTPPRKKWR